MGDSWPRKTIAECASDEPYSTQIGPFGKALTPEEYTSSGVPLLRGVNVNRGRFYDDGFVFISEETADRLSKFESFPGDVLLVHKGTLGQIGLMPKDRKYQRYIMGNSMLCVRCDPAKLIPEYLYYWLCSHEGQHYLFSRVSQVGVPQIQKPLTTLREASLPVPPLDEQKRIAHILGTLDDKIELNQQMNQTLQGIARALFKSWFIDFDPVRAKLDGHQPAGMDTETAALFPDSFENSPLGKIPKGWRVGRLDDLIILQRGFDLPKTNRTSGKYPVLAASGPSGTHNEYKVKGPGVTTGRSGVLGNIFFVHEDFWPLNTSLWVKEFRESRPIHTYYVLQDLNLEVFNAGSAVPTLNRNHVHGLKAVIPPLPVIEVFERLVMLIFQKKKANDEESVDISAVRNALLPKLLSGEICVKDAEQALEAVV